MYAVQWCRQGVLLLNASLSVRAGAPNSHSRKGWEQLTGAAVQALSSQRKGLVFLLWGRFAQERGAVVDKSRHHILTAAHPSGLSASRVSGHCTLVIAMSVVWSAQVVKSAHV